MKGWVCLSKAYDDGGLSGATQRLLADITAGRIDIVVVYKIDRLTRSLTDFANIVEILDTEGASFCFGDASVQHNGLDGALDPECSVVLCAVRARGHRRAHPRQDRRLEEEGDVDGRRAAARDRAQDRKLVIIDSEAEIVRSIFRRYAELGSVRLLKDELEARRIDSRSWTSASGRLVGGKPFSRGALYLILQNLSLEDPDRRK